MRAVFYTSSISLCSKGFKFTNRLEPWLAPNPKVVFKCTGLYVLPSQCVLFIYIPSGAGFFSVAQDWFAICLY